MQKGLPKKTKVVQKKRKEQNSKADQDSEAECRSRSPFECSSSCCLSETSNDSKSPSESSRLIKNLTTLTSSTKNEVNNKIRTDKLYV